MKKKKGIMLPGKMTISFLVSGLLMLSTMFAGAQPMDKEQRMSWFADAKLGIFVHWGIYAVDGIDESWSFFNGYIPHKNYMEQRHGFTASKYDAEEWAQLFRDAGARYTVLTSKHHDGMALWKGGFNHWNTVDHTPAGKDLIAPFVKASRANDMKVGLYYSLIDWSYPDYPAFLRDSVRYTDNGQRWNRFTDFYFTQMKELSTRYNPDLYWFDGDWEHSDTEWKSKELRQMMEGINPGIIVNSRLGKYGDYATPEQGVPVTRPSNPYWELCLTMNDSWGYQPTDVNYKSPYQLLRMFVDCISNGGNLLLDVGPRQDGTIPQEQVETLKYFGRWTTKHSEAIYGTRAGLNPGHTIYPTAFSKDGKTLFVYLDGQPHQNIEIAGISGKIENIRMIGTSKKLKFNTDKTANINIEMPKSGYDSSISVIAIDFKKEPQITKPQIDTNKTLNTLMSDKKWNERHANDLSNSIPGISTSHYNGYSRLSADKTMLYLFVDGKPNGPIMLKGLKNNINRIWVAGHGTRLQHHIYGKLYWSSVPGIAWIDLPNDKAADQTTVITVLLDSPIQLYTEEGQVISNN